MIRNTVPVSIAQPSQSPSRHKEINVDQFCTNALQFNRAGVTVPMLVEHYLGLAADVSAVGQPAKRAIIKRLAEMVEIGVAVKKVTPDQDGRYYWWKFAK